MSDVFGESLVRYNGFSYEGEAFKGVDNCEVHILNNNKRSFEVNLLRG